MSAYPYVFHARRISRSISLSSSRDGLMCSLSFERGDPVPDALTTSIPLSHPQRSLTLWMCAEFLVSTIDDVVRDGGLSESVIGLIILPLVGNVAGLITVVTVAVKDKMDLAIGVLAR